jgi:CBS domain-containing protein
MRAADVMVRDVITVKPDDKVADAVKLLTNYDISALPVVDDNGKIVGILSEADLIYREEIGTQNQHVRWLEAIMPASKLANEFAKSHGQRVDEVMTTDVVTAGEKTPLSEIAKLLEKHRTKRHSNCGKRRTGRNCQPLESYPGFSLGAGACRGWRARIRPKN